MASYILLIQHSLEDPATLPRLWALLILCLFGVPLLACLLACAGGRMGTCHYSSGSETGDLAGDYTHYCKHY